jgi:hypothetical protein
MELTTAVRFASRDDRMPTVCNGFNVALLALQNSTRQPFTRPEDDGRGYGKIWTQPVPARSETEPKCLSYSALSSLRWPDSWNFLKTSSLANS